MQAYYLTPETRIEGIPGTVLGLVARTGEEPRPSAGQVCMRVHAAALNFVDLVFLSGGVPGLSGLVPLIDGAGEIVAVGAGVTQVAVGDRVVANPHQSWIAGELSPESSGVYLGGTVNGMLAEYAVLPEHGVVRMPAHLSFAEAAALPCAGMSAWSSVTGGARRLGVIPGETVLIQGTGGVSLFALQFAKLLGARVIATTSTAAKAERMKAMGAEAVINYVDHPDWGAKTLELTGGRGVDLVVEVGGANTLPQSIQCTRAGGRIAMLGIVAGMGAVEFSRLTPIMQKALVLFGNSTGSRADLVNMIRAIELHQLRPVVDKVFPFAQAADAYRHFASRAHVGKVVISVSR
ncbi:MAG: NAD(P)-dependent alcohol dehydrogenase [Candidatus Binatia bacterium]